MQLSRVTQLKISKLADGFETGFEDFLARHSKLEILNLAFHVKEETLWKLPAMLPNLKSFKFGSFYGFDEDDLKELLSTWDSIEKLTINRQNEREIDLQAATKDFTRSMIVRQRSVNGGNVFRK
jgi:hypothetical protein